MLLKTRIIIIFGIATVLLAGAVALPFRVVQHLSDAERAEARQEAQEATWNAALADAVTPFEIQIARLQRDPTLIAPVEDAGGSALARGLEEARRSAGLVRLDLLAGDGRLLTSSAGIAADKALLDATNLSSRVDNTAWLRGLETGPDGAMLVMLVAPFPGGRYLSAAINAEAVVQTMGRGGKRALFVTDRNDGLLLSTAPDEWPAVARARKATDAAEVLLSRGSSSFAAVATPLRNLAGSRIGTLVVVTDVTGAVQRRALVLLLTGGVAALIFATLLFTLYAFAKDALDPLGEITGVIRAMAAGDVTGATDLQNRSDEVGAIAEALEVFRRDIITLARNKTRETLRQAQQQALIRREMTILASMLDEGDRKALLASLSSTEEGAALAEAFKRMAAQVVAQHAKLAALLAERSRDLTVVREALAERAQLSRLRQELEVARHLQLSSLPRVFPAFPGRTEFELYAAMEPAREVGGDFYDFALVDGDRLAVMIGDASGKGVSAAMFIAMARSILRSAIMRGASPGQALAVANSTLAVENHTMMFATVFVGVLDLQTGWLTYANAGHNAPYVLTPGRGVAALEGASGIALGVLEDASYEDSEVRLAEYSSLLLFTDGVTEAEDPDGGMYGDAELRTVLTALTQADPEVTVAAVQDAVQRFARGADQADDITVLAARWLGAAPEASNPQATMIPIQPEV